MSPRTKVHVLCFVALPIGFAGLAGILNSINPSLVVLALLYPLLIRTWTELIRCPQCDRRIARRRCRFLGPHLLIPSCFVDRYCVHCGYDLDRREPGAGGGDGRKRYQVSLEVAASPAVTGSALADLLGVPPAGLTRERQGESALWRYEPSRGQAGGLGSRVSWLGSELHSDVRSERELRDAGIERVSLGIDVRYDTLTCTVVLPLRSLVLLAESVPELDTVELTCSRSDGDGTSSGDATKGGANEYIVSLDAFTSGSATATDVMEALGLPPEAFAAQWTPDGAVWTHEAEADRTVDLAEQIALLISAAHPRRPLRPGGKVRALFLDIGVIWHVQETDRCAVSLPMPLLRSLGEKLSVGYIRVRCYPGGEEEGGG